MKQELIIAGVVVAVAVATPLVVVPAAMSAVGFTASGITAGSWGAYAMSLGGGSTPALVSVLQSVGAAGLSLPNTILVGATAAGGAVRALRSTL